METKRIEELLEETNSLLISILETLQEGLPKRGSTAYRKSTPLSEEDREQLDNDIPSSLEDWFSVYGENPHPVKYINFTGFPFSKPETNYMFHRLQDFTDEPNEAGTHVWKYLGKKYCKAEKNTVNCFAFVPVTKDNRLNVSY